MIIKLAKTQEEYKKCTDFLTRHKAPILANTILFYIEDIGNNGEQILCVAGYNKEFGGAIEPLYSDNLRATERMYDFMCGFIMGMGNMIIRARSEDEKVIHLLTERLGFKHYNNNEYFKEI